MNKQGRDRLLKKYKPTNKLLLAEPWVSSAEIFNELTKIRHQIDYKVKGSFNRLWEEMKRIHKEPIKLWEDDVEENNVKKIMMEVLGRLTKYYFYGRLYETAKYNKKQSFENLAIEYNKERDEYFFNKTMQKGYPILIKDDILFITETMMTIFEGNYNRLKEKIEREQNRYGKYDKKIFKTAYEIQDDNKGKRPKVTDEDAIVLANQKVKIYEQEELINKYGKRTTKLLNITKSYSNYHKPLLKEGGGEY